jgi:ankyrin repeat protein
MFRLLTDRSFSFRMTSSCNRIEFGHTDAIDYFNHTPLHYACYHGHDECVGALTDDDVQWQNTDENSFGPLHCAAAQGHGECLQALFDDASESLDVNGLDALHRTPLHLSAAGGFNECVRVLTEADDFEPNIANGAGNTGLVLAASNGHHDVCCTLIEFGADYKGEMDGQSVMHLSLASTAPPSGGQVIKVILDRLERDGADVVEMAEFLNQLSSTGESLLHLAADKHDIETIQLLVGSGARLDVADADGLLPLYRLFPDGPSRDCLVALIPTDPLVLNSVMTSVLTQRGLNVTQPGSVLPMTQPMTRPLSTTITLNPED